MSKWFFSSCVSNAHRVIYEVTIKTADDNTHVRVLSWLRGGHIRHVLAHKGFTAAELSNAQPGNQIVVRYFVSTMPQLEAYLSDAAPALRNEGVRLFGESMTADRRILIECDTFYKSTTFV